MNEFKEKNRTIAPALVAIGFLFALAVAASFLPQARLWGINHLAFHAPLVRIIALAIIALSFVPAVNRRAYTGLAKLAELLRTHRRGGWLAALSVAAALAVFMIFGSTTFLLGDGAYVLNNLSVAAQERMTPKTYFDFVTLSEHSWTIAGGGHTAASPGTDLLMFLSSYTARSVFDGDVLLGVKLMSAMMGGLLVLLLFLFVKRTGEPDAWALCVALFVVGSGAMQLFFGYVENYAPAMLLGFVYVFAAYRVFQGRGPVIYPLAALVLAGILHGQAFMLVPSFVFLILWVLWLRNHPALTGWVWKAIVAVATVVAVAAVLRGFAGDYYGDLFGGPYSVFSPDHIVDMVNELLLLLPAGLALYVLGVFSPRGAGDDETPARPLAAFAWCLLVPCLLFLLLFRPKLGMTRDWDLFAFTGLGFALPAVLALRRFLSAERLHERRAAVLIPALTLSLVLTLSWIGVNADAGRSVARFEAILEYDKHHEAYAYETLAKHYEVRGDGNGQRRALRKAIAVSGNPRLKVKLGEATRDMPLTIEGLRELVESKPENDAARVRLLQILATRGDSREVIDIAMAGIKLSPRNPYFPYYVGRSMIAIGRTRDGLLFFEKCELLNPPPELQREIDVVLAELKQRLGIQE